MSNNSFKFIIVDGLADTYPLYGGVGHIIMHKTSNLYATVTMITYNSDRIARQFTRTRFDGIWGRWVSLPFLDASGKIPLDQLPTSVLPASVE